MFISMDVTFREHEPYYGEPEDLSDLFSNLNNIDVSDPHNMTGGAKFGEPGQTLPQGVVIELTHTDDTSCNENGGCPEKDQRLEQHGEEEREEQPEGTNSGEITPGSALSHSSDLN
jgi:hypothetical protein